MPQFDTTYAISLIFWLAVSFGILYTFVLRYFLPRMRARLVQREDVIAKWLMEASNNRKETERALDEAKEMRASTHVEANAAVHKAKEEANAKQHTLDADQDKKLQIRMKSHHNDLNTLVSQSHKHLSAQLPSLVKQAMQRFSI